MSDLKIVVTGASGRMGRTLIREIAQGSGLTLCGALEMEGHPNLGLDSGTLSGMQPNGIKLTADPLTLLADAQVVVDFTTPMVSTMIADLAAQARIVHVIGTTGLSATDIAKIDAAARHAAGAGDRTDSRTGPAGQPRTGVALCFYQRPHHHLRRRDGPAA